MNHTDNSDIKTRSIRRLLFTAVLCLLLTAALAVFGCGKQAASDESSLPNSQTGPGNPDSSAESSSGSSSAESLEDEGYNIPTDDDISYAEESDPTPGEGVNTPVGEKVTPSETAQTASIGETVSVASGASGKIPYSVAVISAETADSEHVIGASSKDTGIAKIVISYRNDNPLGDLAFQISPLFFRLLDADGLTCASCSFTEAEEYAAAAAIPAGETAYLALGFVTDQTAGGPYTLVFDDLLNDTGLQALWTIDL